MTTFKQSYTIKNKQKFISNSTINQKIKYSCTDKNGNPEHNIDDIDSRGVIEIPVTNETVIYQDEEGQYYEVPVSDLIEYDGDDGEITYHNKGKNKNSYSFLNKQNVQLLMLQHSSKAYC